MLSAELRDHGSKPEVIKALADLMGLKLTQFGTVNHAKDLQNPSICAKALIQPTLGGIVADQGGTWKNYPNPMFSVFWMTKNRITETDSKPALVVCPPMLVESWANEANTRFPKLSRLSWRRAVSFEVSYPVEYL